MRIRTHIDIGLALCAVAPVAAFVSPAALEGRRWRQAVTQVVSALNDNFFASIVSNNPFGNTEPAGPDPAEENFLESPSGFDPTPNGLIRQARRLIASDFGILDPDLLDDTGKFVWIGPSVDEPLDKTEYLAAGRFFDLRGAFPDLDYRPHDFRIDDSDPFTLRFTCRVTGTMRGALRLRDGTFPPTGKKMKCPPESVTIKFDEQTGKVAKLCTGFCMDRQVGNTKGATGIMAAALVAGQPPSDWDLYPAPDVFKRFLGRPVQPILETKSVLAPFPETVMIQLAKGILATNMASTDPTLLADNFEFSTPYKGPIRKQEFIEKFALEEFADVDPALSHFRVDPYDPVRVWIDVLPKGDGYEGCPQAMSFSFDDEGFCERITSSFVLDPSVGNGGGLGGPEGYRYAVGKGSPDLLTRPWARVLGRVRKQVLRPFTGLGVDDYKTSAQAKTKLPEPPKPPDTVPSAEVLSSSTVESLSSLRGPVTVPAPPPKPVKPKQVQPKTVKPKQAAPRPIPPKVEPPKPSQAEIAAQIRKRAEAEEARLKKEGAAEAKLLMAEVEAATQRALEAKAKLQKLEEQRMEAERKMKVAQDQNAARMAQIEAQQAAARQKQDEQKAAAAKKKQQDEQKAAAAMQEARAAAAERAAIKAEQLKAERIETERRLREMEEKQQAIAEERKRKEEAQAASYRAMEETRKAQAQERKMKQEAAFKEKEEKRMAQAAAREKKKEAQAAAIREMEQKRKAEAEERKKKQEAAIREMEERRRAQEQERKEKQEAARAAAEQKKRDMIAKREAAAQERKAQMELKRAQAEEQRAALKAAAEAKRAAAAEARQKLVESQQADRARQAEQRRQQAQARQKAEADRKAAIIAKQEADRKAALQAKQEAERKASRIAKQEADRRAALMAKQAAARRQQVVLEDEEDEDEARLARQKAALATLSDSMQRATINLFAPFNPTKDGKPSQSSPSQSMSRSIPITKKSAVPKGVPVLRKWRRTPTGAVTGFVSGSRKFADGEKITTSPIAQGTIGPGQVVRTGSGTQYYLN